MSITNHLKELVPEIIARFPSITVIYLFGSHASGKSGPNSDVDIAVFTNEKETPVMDLELGAFLQQKLQRPVEVVIMQKVSPILQHEVLGNKIRIFEKNRGIRAFSENQSLRAYLDARYYQHKRALWSSPHGKDGRDRTFAEQP